MCVRSTEYCIYFCVLHKVLKLGYMNVDVDLCGFGANTDGVRKNEIKIVHGSTKKVIWWVMTQSKQRVSNLISQP